MILPPGPVRVYVPTKPVDFRKGIDGLAALAGAELRLDPFSGVVLVFRAKRADRIKILVWDGSGMVLIKQPQEELHAVEAEFVFADALLTDGPKCGPPLLRVGLTAAALAHRGRIHASPTTGGLGGADRPQ